MAVSVTGHVDQLVEQAERAIRLSEQVAAEAVDTHLPAAKEGLKKVGDISMTAASGLAKVGATAAINYSMPGGGSLVTPLAHVAIDQSDESVRPVVADFSDASAEKTAEVSKAGIHSSANNSVTAARSLGERSKEYSQDHC